MYTAYEFLADYAADQGGKIYAVGAGFDRVLAHAVPVRHEQMTLVCGIKFSIADSGTKHLSAHLIDADGNDIVPPITGNNTFNAPPAGNEGTARILIRWMNIEFPRYGAYSARVSLDGVQVADVPFSVAPPGQPLI